MGNRLPLAIPTPFRNTIRQTSIRELGRGGEPRGSTRRRDGWSRGLGRTRADRFFHVGSGGTRSGSKVEPFAGGGIEPANAPAPSPLDQTPKKNPTKAKSGQLATAPGRNGFELARTAANGKLRSRPFTTGRGAGYRFRFPQAFLGQPVHLFWKFQTPKGARAVFLFSRPGNKGPTVAGRSRKQVR